MVVNDGGERLKPPPSCINTERKTIKLGNAAKTSSADLNFLIIKKNSSEDSEIKENNKKHKLLEEKRKMTPEPQTGMKKLKIDDHKNKVSHLVSISNFASIFP